MIVVVLVVAEMLTEFDESVVDVVVVCVVDVVLAVEVLDDGSIEVVLVKLEVDVLEVDGEIVVVEDAIIVVVVVSVVVVVVADVVLLMVDVVVVEEEEVVVIEVVDVDEEEEDDDVEVEVVADEIIN